MDHVWGKLAGNETGGLLVACLRLRASGVVLMVGYIQFSKAFSRVAQRTLSLHPQANTKYQ